MGTDTISFRPSDNAWYDPSPSVRADDFTPYDYEASVEEDVRTEPPAALRFEHEVANFQQAIGAKRDAARAAIIKKIVSSDCPDEYIEAVLQTLITSARPGRLDDAVDILSETGHALPQFMCEAFSHEQSANIREDYWYVLLRALGKSRLPAARMLVQLFSLKSPEAAIEALGDIGDEASINALRAFAANGPSDFIRQLAAENIEECAE